MPTRYAKVDDKWFAASKYLDGDFSVGLQAWADQIGAAHDYAPGEVEGVEVEDGGDDPRGKPKQITDPSPPPLPLPEPPLTDEETRALRALLDS